MRITCTQENFSRGLAIVSGVAGRNINLPILNNVLLQSDKEGLTLVTTNLEIGIRTRVRGKTEEEGSFTIQAKLLTEFVGSLKKENINLYLKENTLTLEGENHTTKIKGELAADFPLIPEISEDNVVLLATEEFKKALSQVVFSASSDESRPELNSVLFELEGKNLTLVATDSYRLSERKVALGQNIKESLVLIVPVRTIQQLLRVLELDQTEETKMIISENQIKFSFGSTEIISRIVEGQYPDYKQIIPKKFSSEISFDSGLLAQNIKTTSLFCQPGINDIKMSYLPETKEIQLRAQNSTAGDNLSKIEAETTGQLGEIVFNYRYLLEGINHLDGNKGILRLNEASSPALLQSQDNKEFVYLIMPIRQ